MINNRNFLGFVICVIKLIAIKMITLMTVQEMKYLFSSVKHLLNYSTIYVLLYLHFYNIILFTFIQIVSFLFVPINTSPPTIILK